MKDFESVLRTCLIFLFIIFITIYISYGSGYYEYELHKKVLLTNEQIEKFEEDVKNNKNIDVNNYIEENDTDYSNSFSNISASFSNFTNKYVKKGIEGVFKIISEFMS